jgi:hypothetical protein
MRPDYNYPTAGLAGSHPRLRQNPIYSHGSGFQRSALKRAGENSPGFASHTYLLSPLAGRVSFETVSGDPSAQKITPTYFAAFVRPRANWQRGFLSYLLEHTKMPNESNPIAQ